MSAAQSGSKLPANNEPFYSDKALVVNDSVFRFGTAG